MGKRLRHLLALSHADRLLLASSTLQVAAIRLGLFLLPFRMVRGYVARSAQRARPISSPQSIEKLIKFVHLGARFVPGGTNCLVLSLATHLILRRRGHPSELKIGLRKSDSGELEAHAWIECGGKILSGGPGTECYTPLNFTEQLV